MLKRKKALINLIDEYENQIYNLTLYLARIEDTNPAAWDMLMRTYDGMPGYCRANAIADLSEGDDIFAD